VSTILDALRKLQRERDRDRTLPETPGPLEPLDSLAVAGRGRLSGALTLAGLGLVAASVAWLWLSLGSNDAPGDAASAAVASQPDATPAPSSQTGVASDDGPASFALRAPPAAGRPTPAGVVDGPTRDSPRPASPAPFAAAPHAIVSLPPRPESTAPQTASAQPTLVAQAVPGERAAEPAPAVPPATPPTAGAAQPEPTQRSAQSGDSRRESSTSASPGRKEQVRRRAESGVKVRIIRPEAPEPEPEPEAEPEPAPEAVATRARPVADPATEFPSIRIASIRWHPLAERRVATVERADGERLELHEGDIVDGVMIRQIDPDSLELMLGSVRRRVELEP
jgi:hypothetical protein